MIVDSSAVIAILRAEADAGPIADVIEAAPQRRMSAANYFEAALVIDLARDPISSRQFDDFIADAEIIIEPVTEEHARLARAAYRDFGKGSGHPANLNFGDCFAYALAKSKREPLLFKGSDFTHVDVTPAL
jgi:ribonuclease VapC